MSQSFYQWIVFTGRLNASWYLTVFESTVSSKDCIRRAIDFQIFSRYTACSRFGRLFVTIERLSRQHDCFLVNCFIKEIIFAERWMFERVMIFDARLFESIVSFDRIVKKTKFVVLLIFRYVLAIWLHLDLLHDLFAIWLYLFFRQCQCSVADAWVLDVCFSEALFSFLAITSSGSKTAFYFDFYAISSIASSLRIIRMFDLFLKNFGRILSVFSLSYACSIIWQSIVLFIVLYMTRKVMKLCCVRDFLWSSSFECMIHALLFDSMLWNSRKVSSCQCSLNWDDSLSYDLSWDVCSRSLIHYSNFWFMLACLNFAKMFAATLYFAIYDHMLEYDEMFDACSWHIYFYSHAQILTKCLQRSIYLAVFDRCLIWIWLLFVCFSSDEMFWQLIYISLSVYCCITYKSIFEFWRDVLTSDLCFAVYDFVAFFNDCFTCLGFAETS